MELFDLTLRAAAIALLVMLAILMVGSRISTEGRAAILMVAVSKSAFLLTTTAIDLPFASVVEANLGLLASLTPTALTWLIVAIFVDPPGQKWPWLTASVPVSATLYLSNVFPEFGVICALLATLLYGTLLVLSLWSARDDLVECRCRARPAFAAAIAAVAMFVAGLQGLEIVAPASPFLALLQGVGTLSVTFAFAIWILRPDLSLWPGPRDTEPPRAEPLTDTVVDPTLLSRLRDAMDAGIWREEGLTIGALAARLSVPEHRLRRAINSGLGHRNFSSFINAARISAAREALCDPHEFGTTVIEIAYRVGFASLGPFNRAFRAETGMSPTEFRRMAMAPSADSEKSAPVPSNLH